MSKAEREMDEYAERVLKPLQATVPMDAVKAKESRDKYLLQVETLQKEMAGDKGMSPGKLEHAGSRVAGFKQSVPVFKFLIGVLLAVIFLVVGSVSVYAAQTSLPGEALYTVKTLVEDIRLSLVTSPQERLELTLSYTENRMDEIALLISAGKVLPEGASQRFRGELETALQLAAEMDDLQMQKALGKIKGAAEIQGVTIEELIEKIPDNAEPAITRLQERLQEQVQLSEFGARDPQAFRTQIHGRQLHQNNPGFKKITPVPDGTSTPEPTVKPQRTDEEVHDNGNGQSQGGTNKETEPGQGNDNPGNGNHGPNKTAAP